MGRRYRATDAARSRGAARFPRRQVGSGVAAAVSTGMPVRVRQILPCGRQGVADSPFELHVLAVQIRTEFGCPTQVRSRSEDAEAARASRKPEWVHRVRRLSGLGDDAEHVLGGEVEDGQPVEDFPAGDAHAFVAAPGSAPRAVGALVAAQPEGVYEPSSETGMGLQVAAQLALDGTALRIRRAPPG